MLSRRLRVQDYKVKDIFPYSVGLFFDNDENKKHRREVTSFPKGCPFPSIKTFRYHGNTTLSCLVFYTNKTDFPSGTSPIVGHFKIGTSRAENVKAIINVLLNVHGIVEIESALAVEATRGRARWQIAVSDNYHVLTTKDEIREAQKRAQMFAEQDIKVEQTKEKRNTLESFIYDTLRKLLSSYRSVATDSEVEIMSKSLQDTIDWLYEEGDDESEQVYITKLEDLKKLLDLDPIRSRYKDENDRKEAIKALHTCIQEIRLAADLLPPSVKKEVNNECVQAEECLNQLSQLQDSLAKDATRKYYSSAISGITQDVKGRCEVIMRSKPSFPK